MKYTMPTILIFAILCIIYSQRTKNENENEDVFDISKVRKIEKEAIRLDSLNDNSSILYLDSLSQSFNNDPYSEYFQLINLLKIKLDSKLSNNEKVASLLELLESSSFQDKHEYIRFKTRYELSHLLLGEIHYGAAMEQNALATQCIAPKSDKYCLEMAMLYRDLGYLAGNTFESLEQSKVAYLNAQKIYAQIGDWPSAAFCLYNLALCAYQKEKYDTAALYCNMGISNYKKFTSEPNMLWNVHYPLMFGAYQKASKNNLAFSIYNEAAHLYETGQINKDTYCCFLSEILENMIASGNYDEAEKIITFVLKIKEDNCSNRYIHSLISQGKFLIAKVKNDKETQKKALIKLLYYSSECGETNSFYQKNYTKFLDTLIELEKGMGNPKELVKWYDKRIVLNASYKAENKFYLQRASLWTKLNEDYLQEEIDKRDKDISYRYFAISLTVLLLFLILFKSKHFVKQLIR